MRTKAILPKVYGIYYFNIKYVINVSRYLEDSHGGRQLRQQRKIED